jgi:DNA adenine methylase Dam
MPNYNKSPLNYIGGKYKILPQILEYFPQDINNFIDLFAGGLDVATNVTSKKTFCNDINFYTIQIYEAMQNKSIDEILAYIYNKIEEFNLTKTNEEAYKKFRAYYNRTKNPLDLYILVCYSFNYQFRFNNKHEFNNPFGKNRSCFNATIRDNLIKFHANIKDFVFSSEHFKDYNISFLSKTDFLYADPPYRITVGSYNDGKRGFEGWSKEDDIILFNRLDDLNSGGVKFALSNVSEHKGLINDELVSWAKKYNVHQIEKNYNNSNYQVKDKNSITKEILVTNY